MIKNLENHRLQLETEKETLIKTIQKEQLGRVWVDWVKEFGKRIDDLRDTSLTTEEKKRFLAGVVDQIDVKSTDKQNHELNIKFSLPYLGDRFVYNNPDRKKDGYRIKGGKSSKRVRVNLLKKSIG